MDGEFYISSGVRRSVARLKGGFADIPALVHLSGQPPFLTRLRLDQLHSPKTVVPRDYFYIRRVEYPTCTLRTEPPPIEVEPLGSPGQTASVPLANVRLV